MSNLDKPSRLVCYCVLGFAIVVLLLQSATAQAQGVTIRIEGTEVSRTPIAVVPFAWQGRTSEPPLDVSQVIRDDLYASGRFDPIPESGMLQTPTTRREVDFDDWTILGVEAVVIGTVTQTGDDEFTIQYHLFDPVRQEELDSFRLPATRNMLRRETHRIADRIYEELTGIKGVFATRVAYVSAREVAGDEVYRLVVADYDGANEYPMLESTDPLMSPAWSPDGRRIAYVSFEDDRSSIFVQTLRTQNRIRVSAEPGINGAPSFSPDGRKLVMTLGGIDGNLDIYTLDLRTRERQRLTTHRGIDTEGTWSPDGRYIYFTSDRSGGPQIYRVPAAGGNPERITFEGSYNARPRLSPDGEILAMIHNFNGNFRIAMMDLDSRNLIVLSTGSQDESPSFAPNSEIIIYATRFSGDGVLETVSVDGLIRSRRTSGTGDIREPVWGPFPRF